MKESFFALSRYLYAMNQKTADFQRLILTRYNIYNGLFLNLPYAKEDGVGALLPVLSKHVKEGLDKGQEANQILNEFFQSIDSISSEQEQLDFMFKVVQYIERQVVLYDAVEDAAFPEMQKQTSKPTIQSLLTPSAGHTPEEAIEALNDFSTRLVFTAHPTQFYQPAILAIIQKLGDLIKDNALNEIDETLQQLGLTTLLNMDKPTPLEEAKNIIYYLRNVYYDAIHELHKNVKQATGQKLTNHELVALGFWPGGDRDGNPFVRAHITNQVADELRMTLMKCYYRDVKALQSKVTFKNVQADLGQLRARLYSAMFNQDVPPTYSEIVSTLESIRDEVQAHYHGLFVEEIEDLLDKVHIFGTHFASIDIRQDHDVHRFLIQNILEQTGHNQASLSAQEQLDLFSNDLDLSKIQLEDEIQADTLTNISQLPSIQDKNGEKGCHRYIISNSEDVFSVINVFSLLKNLWPKDRPLSMDICPLFETIVGLDAAKSVMEELFSMPAYREHVRQRGNVQTIMLGFSDGTKDGGYLKANWSIFKTKEILSQVCAEHGIDVMFFDGRGGPPARGGGKTHRFYAAQSDQIATKEIQLTIQGQTITSTFGTGPQFKYNCEQLITAGVSNVLHGKEQVISSENRALIEKLSELSYEKYQSLKHDPMFIPYLAEKSTLKYYAKANIGSRPSKRGKQKELTLSDLRAISFVGSWSQLKQNVPGYYGLGTALNHIAKAGKMDQIKSLFNEVPLFRALLLNSMMSLSKSNFKLTSYLEHDEKFGDFWKNLRSEYLLSKEMLLEVSGYDKLMQEEPNSMMSIEMREQIVLPLLIIQQSALQRIEKGTSLQETYEKLVTRSLYGNINASRNSA